MIILQFWRDTGGENDVSCWQCCLSRSSSEITLLRAKNKLHLRVCTPPSVHADSDIMHGCPLRFIIKAPSACTGSEGENMNRIKQIVWCVKDRQCSSKVLKLLLPTDWQGRMVGARNERCLPVISLPFSCSSYGVSKALRHCLCKVPVSARAMSIK